jgi:two-component system, sensor histidine kinase and response regulator
MISKTLKVLLVDDFEPMRKIIVDQLKNMGVHQITQAASGDEALHLLLRNSFDIVLSNWKMPKMSGLELLKAVRADPKLNHLPLIIITSESNRNNIIEAITYDVTDILVKPYSAKLLSEKVERAMQWKPSKISKHRLSGGLVPTSSKHQSSTPATEENRPNILIVDDIPSNLHLLSELFKNDYQIRIATNGETVLKICAAKNVPDLILLDIMMPGMDGFEVAKRLRQQANSENIPIIFITALSDVDARMQGFELGAVDFVSKPINPNELKQRIINFLRYVELQKNLQAYVDEMLASSRVHEDVEQITRHDLKSHLVGVISLLHSLEADDTLSPKQMEHLRIVEETTLRVINMIDFSTELYQIESGEFQLDTKPVKIGDILRCIVELTRKLFHEKHLVILLEADISSVGEQIPHILGDAMLCYSLFHNLIINACEAAPEKSKILISMKDEYPLKIIIQNKGVVHNEIRKKFFDKFVTYGKPGRAGLGTYSAKLLTEAQNGKIELEISDEHNQTTINVFLPRLLQ